MVIRKGEGLAGSEREMRRKLSALTPRRLSEECAGEASVLIGMVPRDGRDCFLLTRRTEQVATHKGQISFPGGMREAGDLSSVDTALRESQEELGIHHSSVEILGEFHEYLAVTDQRVRCHAGFVSPDAEFQPQSSEVAYVLEVPFDFFALTDPVVEQRFRQGRTQNVYFYDFEGETIWGLTARIIKEFVDFVGTGGR